MDAQLQNPPLSPDRPVSKPIKRPVPIEFKDSAWKPGQSGNPGGRPRKRKSRAASEENLKQFQAQPLEHQVKILKQQASTIAYLTGHDLIADGKRPAPKTVDIQAGKLFGITFDKAAAGTEGSDLVIKIPACLQGCFSAYIVAKSNAQAISTTTQNLENHSQEAPKALEGQANPPRLISAELS